MKIKTLESLGWKLGLITGIITVVLYFFSIFSEIFLEEPNFLYYFILLIVSIVQIGTIVLVFHFFVRLFVRWEIHPLFAILMGAIFGAVGGFIAGGFTFGLLFALSIPSGMIQMNENAGWAEHWYTAFGYAFLAGGAFGSMFGLPAGLVTAPVFRIFSKRLKQKAEKGPKT